MGLSDKYRQAILTAKSVGMQCRVEERDGKLYVTGVTRTHDDLTRIWSAIRAVPGWQTDVVAEIRALGPAPLAALRGLRTYVVKAGETLSQIAKAELGNADAYSEIFDANRDQLDDPNTIRAGQVLWIPAAIR